MNKRSVALTGSNKVVSLKVALVALAMISSTSICASSEDPHQQFSTNKNNTNKSIITWRPVDRVQAECDKESKRLGYGGFGYPLEACSFWDKSPINNVCTIITGKNVNFHTVGHEIRHCFQGNFHK